MMTGLNRIFNDKSEMFAEISSIALADSTLINYTQNTSNVSHFFPENMAATT